MNYLFGDTELAARRLALLARVYRSSTEAFLKEAAGPSPQASLQIAIDLGCGPGHTTRLVAETTGARHTVGLDNSAAFVAQANAEAAPNLTFYRHNVCHVPLPAAPADLMFARYLLAHLKAPELLARQWVAQLTRGGRLLLEEVELIETDVEAFADYLGIVERMLADSGSDLYVGRKLARLNLDGIARVAHSELCRIPVSNEDAATMFSMNIATWSTNPFIRARYESGDILALERELVQIAEADETQGSIVWSQRQVAFVRK